MKVLYRRWIVRIHWQRQRFLIRHDIVASCWMSWSFCDFVVFAFGHVTRTQCEPHLLYLSMSLHKQMFRVEIAHCMSNSQLGKICACDIFEYGNPLTPVQLLGSSLWWRSNCNKEKVTLSSISVAVVAGVCTAIFKFHGNSWELKLFRFDRNNIVTGFFGSSVAHFRWQTHSFTALFPTCPARCTFAQK